MNVSGMLAVVRPERPRLKTLWLLAGCSLLTLLASFEPMVTYLTYHQDWIDQGEYWRPLTASVAQLHSRHWLLNQWGLILMALLLPRALGRADYLALALVWLLVSVTLPFSGYSHYAGISGVLYGWLIWSVLTSPYYKGRLLLLVALGISAKVLLENMPGISDWANASTARYIDAEVAVQAHLWGLLGGWLAILLQAVCNRTRG